MINVVSGPDVKRMCKPFNIGGYILEFNGNFETMTDHSLQSLSTDIIREALLNIIITLQWCNITIFCLPYIIREWIVTNNHGNWSTEEAPARKNGKMINISSPRPYWNINYQHLVAHEIGHDAHEALLGFKLSDKELSPLFRKYMELRGISNWKSGMDYPHYHRAEEIFADDFAYLFCPKIPKEEFKYYSKIGFPNDKVKEFILSLVLNTNNNKEEQTMKTICLDPGHGGKDRWNVGPTGYVEADGVLDIALHTRDFLKSYRDLKIIMTRTSNNNLFWEDDKIRDLRSRANFANENNADYFVSIHSNAADNREAKGTEAFCLAKGGEGELLANAVLDSVINTLGTNSRGLKEANFAVLRETDMPAALIEVAFHSNEKEEALLKDPMFRKSAGIAIAKGILKFLNITILSENKVAIMGKAKATKNQMKQYLLSINPNPQINCTVDELVEFYLQEGEIEGIRGDVAFAQALKETGYFKYGGIVHPEQNNYAGLGALNNNKPGEAASFTTPQVGIQAQIQHLKGYATFEPPFQRIVDPRYQILKDSLLLGTAPYVTDLNGKWAYPGVGYGESIIKILNNILSINIEETSDDSSEYQEEPQEPEFDYEKLIQEKDDEIGLLKEEIKLLKDKLEKIKHIILLQ